MRYLILISILSTLASCGIYSSRFDCPPGKGIGCAPVGEVLDLIVEREEGEDIFARDKGTALLLRQQEENQLIRTSTEAQKKFYLIKDETGNLKLVKAPKENEA